MPFPKYKYMTECYENLPDFKKEQIKALQREYTKKTKEKIFKILGRVCVKCGFDNPLALQVDHVFGDGFKSRKKFKSGYRGISINQKLYAIQKSRERFQILCANCHQIKTFESKEHFKHRITG